MFKKIFEIIKFINNIKLCFDLPKSKKILLYDEGHNELLKKTIKEDFNILNIRNKKVYVLIFLKQIVYFDFKFSTYCKNYIKFTSPKIVITLNTKREEFFRLKDSFPKIYFISVMSGLCYNDTFIGKKKSKLYPLKCDYFYVLNKYYIKKFQKYIQSKYEILGHHKNNLVKIKKTKFKGEFLFISRLYKDKYTLNFNSKLLNLINLYLLNHKKKLHILLRGTATLTKKEEIEFYKKILKNNCVFYDSTRWEKKYQILDNFENIISTYSGMGYEAIARKKKIVFFSPNIFAGSKYYFGWPAPSNIQKKHNFFSAKNLNYYEVKRILNNIKNCSQFNWEKNYYPILQDQSPYDINNQKLRNLIIKLIKG